jgi:hypothetical protein
MKRIVLFLPLTALVLMAQVNAPTIGIARLADGNVRALSGLPENLVLTPHSFGVFDAASFSDSAGLVAKNGLIQLVTPSFQVLGEYASAEQHPVLNVDSGAMSAIAWLPSSHSIVYWNGTQFVTALVESVGQTFQATAIRLTGNTAQMLLTGTDNAVFAANISLSSGELVSISALPGIRGPAFWQGTDVLFVSENQLRVAAANGTIRSLAAMDSSASFARASSAWTVVTPAAGRTLAVHFGKGDINISELPQESTR